MSLDVVLQSGIGKVASFFMYGSNGSNIFSSGVITDVFTNNHSILVFFGEANTIEICDYNNLTTYKDGNEVHYCVGGEVEVIMEE